MNKVLLYSAGLDSYVTLKYIRKFIDDHIKVVHYDINSVYSQYEINCIKSQDVNCTINNTFDLSKNEKPDANIPHRNLYMAMHAAECYDADVVYIGGTKSDNVSDNNKEIMMQLSNLISTSLDRRVTVTSPWWDYYKSDAIMWYNKTYNDSKSREYLMRNTFSCYHPVPTYKIRYYKCGNDIYEYEGNECNSCSACFRKSIQMYNIGMFRTFFNIPLVVTYASRSNKYNLNTPRDIITNAYIKELYKHNDEYNQEITIDKDLI